MVSLNIIRKNILHLIYFLGAAGAFCLNAMQCYGDVLGNTPNGN
jgi:hypothetical protein